MCSRCVYQRSASLFNRQWDVWIADAGRSGEKPGPPSLHAVPQTRTTCPVPGTLILLLCCNFPLSAPSSCYRLYPAPHPGKKKNARTSKIKKHMWLAIKLHMHSEYPNPPLTPNPTLPSPPTTQRTDTHSDLQRGEESYMRGDVETMGRGGSNIRQQSELSLAGEQKQRRFGRGVGGVRQW